MSMFTTIINSVDGQEFQIYTGHDTCDTYKVGDIVDWHIYPDLPGEGKLLDGVYTAENTKLDKRYLVVINKHKVTEGITDSNLSDAG